MNALRWISTYFVMLLLLVVATSPSFGYSPQDAKVKAMVKKGVAHLNSIKLSERLGERCLVALALYKAGEPKSNPKIQETVKGVLADVPAISKLKKGQKGKFVHAMTYDVALALILLCELEPDAYPEEINQLIDYFVKNQKPAGGWGYPHEDLSDNSMTQYGALGLWLADQNGYVVPVETMEKVCNYIIRVQDPAGAWGYKGVDPGPNAKRVAQSNVRSPLVAASMAALYITADFLHLNGRKKTGSNSTDGVPSVLQEIKTPDPNARKTGPRTKKVNVQSIKNAKAGGLAWLKKNPSLEIQVWRYYLMYGIERFESFRELETGQSGKDAPWYNKGVDFLEKKQNKDGSWTAVSEDAARGTSFAILFLVRSTGKSIQKNAKKYDDGVLRGGRKMPTDLADAQIKDGKVVGKVEIVETDAFISLLESGGDDEQLSNMLNAGASYTLSEDERGRDIQIVILRRKIRDGSFSARMLAIKTIKIAKDFDSVPVLVYALTDPDWRVARESRDALRYISRKFSGYGMPERAKAADKDLAAEKWKAWYLSIQPDAEFLD